MKSTIPLKRLSLFAPTLLLLLCLAAPLCASDRYLAPGRPDAVALLAPPPEPDSEEQSADLQQVREVVKARTSAETAQARIDMQLSVFNFAQAIGPVFAPGKFPKTEALLAKMSLDTREIVGAAKDHWKRKRPYEFDPSLAFGKLEPSSSYPSGHSTFGTVNALVLAELFPDKREAILALGRRIGWDRVLTGYHFLTDVRAGRVLGQAIVRELMANPAFEHDLAEAKAEIAAAPPPR
jgi:membrane-associated phospholipid phosphatase